MAKITAIQVAIRMPAHQQSFVGSGNAVTVNVPLQGAVLQTAFPNPAALVRTWYSGLNGKLAVSESTTVALPTGSHSITLVVQDKSDEGVPNQQLAAFYKTIEHIGAAGGPPGPPVQPGNPCVIHVLIATLLEPAVEGSNLSKRAAVLEAQVPLQWVNHADPGTLNPDYHAINKLRYRWFLRPLATSGASVEVDHRNGQLLRWLPYDKSKNLPPRLQYSGVLPAEVVTNSRYQLILRVEHRDNPALGHEAVRIVQITD